MVNTLIVVPQRLMAILERAASIESGTMRRITVEHSITSHISHIVTVAELPGRDQKL